MKKLATILALTAVVANLGIASVLAQSTSGTQDIGCNTAGASSIVTTAAVAFDSRTTDFEHETAASLDSLLDGGLQIDVTDTRGYDPGVGVDEICGDAYEVQIQSAAGLSNTIDSLALQLGTALVNGDLSCTSGSCSPTSVNDVATADGTTGAIATAQPIISFSEAFSGTIRGALIESDLQVTPPSTQITSGTYTGTILFTLV